MNADERLMQLAIFFCDVHPMFREKWDEWSEAEDEGASPDPTEALVQFGAMISDRVAELTDGQLDQIADELDRAYAFPHWDVGTAIATEFLDTVCASWYQNRKVQRVIERLGPGCFQYCRDTNAAMRIERIER